VKAHRQTSGLFLSALAEVTHQLFNRYLRFGHETIDPSAEKGNEE
jgi:hypothetical protein